MLLRYQLDTEGYWNSRENRKHFFETFAAGRGVDPLVASSWHSVRRGELLRKKVEFYLINISEQNLIFVGGKIPSEQIS